MRAGPTPDALAAEEGREGLPSHRRPARVLLFSNSGLRVYMTSWTAVCMSNRGDGDAGGVFASRGCCNMRITLLTTTHAHRTPAKAHTRTNPHAPPPPHTHIPIPTHLHVVVVIRAGLVGGAQQRGLALLVGRRERQRVGAGRLDGRKRPLRNHRLRRAARGQPHHDWVRGGDGVPAAGGGRVRVVTCRWSCFSVYTPRPGEHVPTACASA